MRNSESLYPAFPWNGAQMHYFPALGLGGWVIVVVLLAVLTWAIWKSKSPAPHIADTDVVPAPGD